jgi:hypothetical protein
MGTSFALIWLSTPILDNSVEHSGSSEISNIGANLLGPANPGVDANATMSMDAGKHSWALTPSAKAMDAGEHVWALL